MAEISAGIVKELREATGLGMMDCKRALVECDGDMEAAKDWLRKRGLAIADKKAGRKAADGLVFVHVGDDAAAMLELNCETDFVARNEAFPALGQTLSKMVAEGVHGQNGTLDDLLATPSPVGGGTVADLIKEKIATMGENLGIGAFVRVPAQSGSVFHSYIHPPGKLGVLVQIQATDASVKDREEFRELCRDLAMHIAAAAPESLDRSAVSPEKLEREKAIYREQAVQEGKGEKFLDKIVEGRLGKYYKQVCLLEQEFVKNPDETVQQLVDRVSKQVGDQLKVVGFERMKVGG